MAKQRNECGVAFLAALGARRVIVKLHDGTPFPNDDGWREEVDHDKAAAVPQGFAGLKVHPLFGSVNHKALRQLTDRAIASDSGYHPPDFLSYYAVTVPAPCDPDVVAIELRKMAVVERAYVEPAPCVPPSVSPGDDVRSPYQGYLDPAHDGIDAEFAWGFPGGDGDGQALVDLEWGWTFNHQDLAAHGITLISGINKAYFFHGTGVLGEIASVDNALGCIGITPNLASIRCVSQWRCHSFYSTSEAIMDAIVLMEFGDVLLLEAQTAYAGYNYVPVEIEPAVFDTIRLATAANIVVVEAAGNGAIDLDTIVVDGKNVFVPALPEEDSRAIIVGGATESVPHIPIPQTCYGRRVNCFGWARKVNTLSSNGDGTATNRYTDSFNGTSSASAIVAGAALAVQGLAEKNLGHRWGALEVRDILGDPDLGTPSATPDTDRIGVMPNLRRIIEGESFNLAPKPYLRDHVGDYGDGGPKRFASPDLFLRHAVEPDPQRSFGDGSGSENKLTISLPARTENDNYLYVRMKNHGSEDADDVHVRLFWAPPTTFAAPHLWTHIAGTKMPRVLTGDLLTVSQHVTWPAKDVPKNGDYTLAAVVDASAERPMPVSDLCNWEVYRQALRGKHRLAVRNYHFVKELENDDPNDFIRLPFIASGFSDKTRRMRLEVVARLPRQALVLMEMPRAFADQLRVQAVLEPVDSGSETVKVRMNRSGLTQFSEIDFPAQIQVPLQVLVHLPSTARKHSFVVFARQTYECEEVGRITWHIGRRS